MHRFMIDTHREDLEPADLLKLGIEALEKFEARENEEPRFEGVVGENDIGVRMVRMGRSMYRMTFE